MIILRLLENLWIWNRSSTSQCRSQHAFKNSISFATDLAANFGFGRFKLLPEIVSKLLSTDIWSATVAVLFNWNLSTRPFLGYVVDVELLLCTGIDSKHGDMNQMMILILSLTLLRDQRMIERLSEARARLWSVKSSHKVHRKFHLYHHCQIIWRNKYLIRHVSKFIMHQDLFYSRNKSVSQECKHFSLKRASCGSQRLQPIRKRPVFVLARPTRPAVPERALRALPLILQSSSKALTVFWNSLREWRPDDWQGPVLGLKLEFCRLPGWPRSCKGFACSEIPE